MWLRGLDSWLGGRAESGLNALGNIEVNEPRNRHGTLNQGQRDEVRASLAGGNDAKNIEHQNDDKESANENDTGRMRSPEKHPADDGEDDETEHKIHPSVRKFVELGEREQGPNDGRPDAED
jgi:hypothetical protein